MTYRRGARHRGLWAGLALAAGLTAVPHVEAGQFSVSPVRIFMMPRERATAITLTNEGDTELVMQADLYDWAQAPDGEDKLTLSEDMILSPPIIKLAPRARQVVRLALLRPAALTAQRTFRLIVREIPEAKAESDTVKLHIAMAFSLPVFITPPGAKRDLACTGTRQAPSLVKVHCENKGKAYAQILEMQLKSADALLLAGSQAPAYLLPGTQRSFDLKAEAPFVAGPAKLHVRQDDGKTQVFDLTLAD